MKPAFSIPMTVATVLCLASPPPGHAGERDAFGMEKAISRHLSQSETQTMRLDDLVDQGHQLFLAKFTVTEGAGRPEATGAIVPTKAPPSDLPRMFRTAGPDSTACRACHNDPTPGGAGDFVANAFVSEGFSDADFDTVDPQFSNERGTPALNGSGLVELLAREMTATLRAERKRATHEARTTGKAVSVNLKAKGISFGSLTIEPDGFMDVSQLQGVDQDLLVRPFSQKGVFTSLRQFTVNALNGHHGMQAAERFGAQFTDTADFDNDGVSDELTTGDVTALVAFQATLPTPYVKLPEDAGLRAQVDAGRKRFADIGCASCHVPELPLDSAVFTEPNPYNPAGNLRAQDVTQPVSFALNVEGLAHDDQGRVLVPVFSDFKRHVIADADRPHFANELLAQRFVNRDEFLTPRLWGVGSSAPYGHRGDLSTMTEAIANHGGEATDARQAFEALSADDRRQIIGFLQTLRLPGEEVVQ